MILRISKNIWPPLLLLFLPMFVTGYISAIFDSTFAEVCLPCWSLSKCFCQSLSGWSYFPIQLKVNKVKFAPFVQFFKQNQFFWHFLNFIFLKSMAHRHMNQILHYQIWIDLVKLFYLIKINGNSQKYNKKIFTCGPFSYCLLTAVCPPTKIEDPVKELDKSSSWRIWQLLNFS